MPVHPSRARRATLPVAVAGLLASAVVALAPSPAVAAPGDLDSSWNGTGTAITPVSAANGFDDAYATAVQTDGKVVVAGKAQSGNGKPQMAIARFTAGGAIDTTFDSDGKVVVPYLFGSGDTNGDQANAVAVTDTGRILVAGYASHSNGDGALAVAAYTGGGAPDTTFGTNGVATVVIGAGGAYNSANSMALQPDGKVVLAGTWAGGWVVARLDDSGVLDTSFNSTGSQPGTRRLDLGDEFADNPYAVAMDTQGATPDILVGGSGAHDPTAGAGAFDQDFALVRLNSDGSSDGAFGTGGIVRTDFGGDLDQVDALAVLPDGKVVAAGHTGTSGSARLSVARYDVNGALDTGFNTTGQQTVTGGVDANSPWSGLGLLEDGSVVAASTSASQDLLVAKLTPTGAPDIGFGAGGVVTTNVAGADVARALTIGRSGRAIVVGTTPSSSGTAWVSARYLTAAAPTVTTHPTDQSGCDTGTASFTAAGAGSTPRTYQWQTSPSGGGGFTDLTNGPGVSGATSPMLNLSGLTVADNGSLYRAVISDGGGSVTTDPATLAAGTSPSITAQPADELRSRGATVDFTAGASGAPAPTVQWQISTDGGGTFTPVNGATNDTYTTTATAADDGNVYHATYSNLCGSIDSSDATLTVQAVADKQVSVSEFRLVGPAGAGDWYVNLHNTTGAPVNLGGWTLALLLDNGTQPEIDLPAVVVPAGATALVTGGSYSLTSYASADLTVPVNADPQGGVRVSGPGGLVTDRAGIAFTDFTLREGAGIPAATTGSGSFAFARAYNAGVPVDTDDNATDFTLVAADGATADHGPGTTLGSPSPRSLASPLARNDVAQSFLYDPSRTATQAPNRVVTGALPNKTLLVRRRIHNTSGATITNLRLRITSMTTYGNTTPAQAILVATTSSTEPGIAAATLDAPPSDPSGGGIGSSLTVDLPPGGLANGDSVNVNLLFKVVRGGSFSFGYNAEIG